jgi:hypothetical protein
MGCSHHQYAEMFATLSHSTTENGKKKKKKKKKKKNQDVHERRAKHTDSSALCRL